MIDWCMYTAWNIFTRNVGQQNLKHLASSLGTGSSHGHLRTWGWCAGIHPLWNSKAGFCASKCGWRWKKDLKNCFFPLKERFEHCWFSLFNSFPLIFNFSIQNSSKVNCLQNARRQAPLESVKSHPFKFPAQLEELSNLVRVMVGWCILGSFI